MKKILIIAPHMDDEALGCGGTIAKHAASGDEVYVCFVAHRIYDHTYNAEKNEVEKQHSLKAKEILGYKEGVYLNLSDERLDACIQEVLIPLENYIAQVKPEIVYCPFYGDNHQDHRAVFGVARVALRPAATDYVKQVLLYETPSSTEQSPPTIENVFLPNHYVRVDDFINKKIEAFTCYATEERRHPHPRSNQALQVLAQKRGVEIGFNYAEAFMLIRNKCE